jgi:hypothetical protein
LIGLAENHFIQSVNLREAENKSDYDKIIPFVHICSFKMLCARAA